MRKWICTVVTASLLLPVMAVADQSDSVVAMVARGVPAQAFEAQILLIGETHDKPRSHALTWVLIQRALSHHDCVHFALEVPSDGKTEWRRAATQLEAIEQIGITLIHDTPSLRRLMARTSELARHACLGLHPIDEPAGYDAGVQDRDKYMARQLTRLAKTGKFIIALLGSNHAVRHLDWKDDFQDKPVAQLVSEAGVSFLGLLTSGGRSRKARWIVQRKTAEDRFARALREIDRWCRAHRWPVPTQQQVLRRKLQGHYAYYGITGNSRALGRFLYEVHRLWRKWLHRRSWRGRMPWEPFYRLLRCYPLPPPRVVHSVYRSVATP